MEFIINDWYREVLLQDNYTEVIFIECVCVTLFYEFNQGRKVQMAKYWKNRESKEWREEQKK